MVLTIRPACEDDAAEAMDILNTIVAVGGTTALQNPLTVTEMIEWFLLPGPRVWLCHVALQDDVMVGFQSVGHSTDLPTGWGEMGTYARVGQSQQGIGSALFAQTVGAARAIGLTHLNAKIRNDNLGGLAYYARMGFGDDHPAPDATLKSGKVVGRVNKRLVL